MVRWLWGSVTFLLPAMAAICGELLDGSRFGHDPHYTALIPYVFWGAVLLAALIPAMLIMGTRMALLHRIGATGLLWCGLLLQFYLILLWVLNDIQ